MLFRSKQLYGGVWKEYRELPFFKKVAAYTDDLWESFNFSGHIKCPISDYKFYNNELENMNPQKLLNYVLQNLETANNVNILYEIFLFFAFNKNIEIYNVIINMLKR